MQLMVQMQKFSYYKNINYYIIQILNKWILINVGKIILGIHMSQRYSDVRINSIERNIEKNPLDYLNYIKKNKNEKEMDSEYIDKFSEIYVVASDWSWTYMKTHEEECGPYFYRP